MRVRAPHSPDAGGLGYSLIDRRTFIGTQAGGLLAAPLAAGAQQAGKVYRIGYLTGGTGQPDDELERALGRLGWIKGQNLAIEYRWAEGKYERFPALAEELVRLNVDVIVAPPTAAALAAQKATRSITLTRVPPHGAGVEATAIALCSGGGCGKDVRGLSRGALLALEGYDWPGNVRELENIVERSVALATRPVIGLDDLPLELAMHEAAGSRGEGETAPLTLRQARDRFEQAYVLRALEREGWNQSRAARGLGVHRNTLIARLAAWGFRLGEPGISVRPLAGGEGPG